MINKKIFIIIFIVFIFLIYNIKYKNIENFSENENIPRIIYKTGFEEKNNLNEEVKNLFKLTEKNNNVKIRYFSDSDCINFIKKNYNKDVVNAFNKLKPGSFKADLFRYCILYKKGGIWSDLTDKFLISIDDIIDFNKDNLVLVEDRIESPFKYPGIQISFMATKPNSIIFKKAIDKVVDNCKKNNYGKNPLDVTGPYVFRNIFEKEKDKLNYKMDIKFNGKYYLLKKNNQKIILNKSISRDKLKKILNQTTKNYVSMWHNNDIFN